MINGERIVADIVQTIKPIEESVKKPFKPRKKIEHKLRGKERIKKYQYYRKFKHRIHLQQKRYRRRRKMDLKRRRKIPPHFQRVSNQPLLQHRDYTGVNQLKKNYKEIIQSSLLGKELEKESDQKIDRIIRNPVTRNPELNIDTGRHRDNLYKKEIVFENIV